MMLTPEQLATARKINSRRKQLTYEAVDLLLDHIDAQQARIAELEQDAARLREFVAKVAQQTPEKPDYWSSCGQCERNASEADELIEPVPGAWPEDASDYSSRIAAIGQIGNDGLHYGQEQEGGGDGSA